LDDKFKDAFDEEADLVPDESEEGLVQVGKSAHRCSMIKKYNIKTFFTPSKERKTAFQTEQKPR
jgi:hypothetical protein